MSWSSVTATPPTWKTRTGCGARPGDVRIAWFPKMSSVAAGMATESPMVATTFVMAWA